MASGSSAILRDVVPADFGAVLNLNAESVDALSPLDLPELQRLHNQAAYHRGIDVDGELVAVLLALAKGVNYGSLNYRWFSAHADEFLYIDRVVVRRDWQRRQCGRRLYDDAIAFARQREYQRLVCEFNIVPLNEASRAFHGRYGFREVGTQWIGATKQVSLQELSLRRHAP